MAKRLDSDVDILEGFICPICRQDMKSVDTLINHFERMHAEEEDAVKSIFRDIFTKAKRKILVNFDEASELSRSLDKNASINDGNATSNMRSRMNVFNFMEAQEVGVERGNFEYFQLIRNPRIERYANETNKLIIRLHKLLKDMPADPVLRKQHEQKTVVWLDGSTVKLCPNCAKSFHIARRQHHCRLCGSIMCNDCSNFLQIDKALELASLSMTQNQHVEHVQDGASKNETVGNQQQNGLRTCSHCQWLLETRQQMYESHRCKPPITQIYAEIQQLKKEVTPNIEMYLKIINSLYDGESIFTIADASALRGKIGQSAEAIDLRSKRILALPAEEGSREAALYKVIRLSCIQLIKEKMLSLPSLPSDDEVRKAQDRKRMETEQRMQTERRQALEAYERHSVSTSSDSHYQYQIKTDDGNYVQGSDLHSLDNWTAHQISAAGVKQNDDPLVEQINIIKGYIKQARQDMNFDVVETLEMNLRELQREFYERHQKKTATENHP